MTNKILLIPIILCVKKNPLLQMYLYKSRFESWFILLLILHKIKQNGKRIHSRISQEIYFKKTKKPIYRNVQCMSIIKFTYIHVVGKLIISAELMYRAKMSPYKSRGDYFKLFTDFSYFFL